MMYVMRVAMKGLYLWFTRHLQIQQNDRNPNELEIAARNCIMLC